MGTDPRESLGRIVRAVWVRWAREQPHPKPSWLVPWARLDAGQREVDMQIGEAVQRAALRQAARQILLLDALHHNSICPRCHGKTEHKPSYWDPDGRCRCVNGHEWPLRPNRGPYNSIDSSIRRLARGEPLPDVPPKEGTDD